MARSDGIFDLLLKVCVLYRVGFGQLALMQVLSCRSQWLNSL